jgi:hypothetical protein
MSGAVALGSLLAVIELGAPVASNLGLGIGLPAAGHRGIVSQPFGNPNLPSGGPAASPVVSATSAPSVVPAPAAIPEAGTEVPVVVPNGTVTTSAPQQAITATAVLVSSHLVSQTAAVTVPPASGAPGGVQPNVLAASPTAGAGGVLQSQSDQQGAGQGNGAPHAQDKGQSNGAQHGQGGGQGNNGQQSHGNHGHQGGSD